MVVLCHTQEQAEQVKARLAEWLAPRGLAFNEDKTKIVHLGEGFDFLGFNVRRYHRKLLIKPSKAAIKRLRERLAAEMRTLRGSNAVAVIATLNPIIRGWAAYYRRVVSSEAFHSLDTYLWKLTYKWATMAPPQQAEAVDRRPLLRQVQQVQERPLGVRRPRQRRLPGQVLLDRHRPARPGHGRGITRRPRPDRVLGRTAREGQTPAGQLHAAPARQAGRRAARSAGTTCSPPTSHHSPPTSGNDGGCRSPARR